KRSEDRFDHRVGYGPRAGMSREATPRRSATGRVSAAYEPVPEQARLAVERDLRARLKGDVRFDAGSRALYATDASNYRQVPVGVVVPRDIDDVVATIELCRKHDVPVLPRGGGTSL